MNTVANILRQWSTSQEMSQPRNGLLWR